MTKVSVVIPAYNAVNFLPETLASVQSQSFLDFEVLIVDDGSSDGTKIWFSQSISDPRIKLVSQANQGLSGARNTGIEQSKSEYIAFLDADDTWAATKLEKQVAFLDENPTVGLVHTWYAMMDMDSVLTGTTFKNRTAGHVHRQLLVQNSIGVASVMARRECFQRVGGFNRKLRAVEDWDMWIRISRFYEIGLIPEILTFYRQVPTSLSKNCEAMEASFESVIEASFEAVPDGLSYLKRRSYGCANFCLAWKALQGVDQDSRLALRYYLRALRSSPRIGLSGESFRLAAAILMMSILGGERYLAVLKKFNDLRR
jgi:glycosyltransferase involved in cell wall biosynthesis